MHAAKLSGKINVSKQLNINNTPAFQYPLSEPSDKQKCCGQSCLVGLSSCIILAAVPGVPLCTACEGVCTKAICTVAERSLPLKGTAGAMCPVAIPAGTISVSLLSRLLCPRTLLHQVLPVEKSSGFLGTRNPPDFLGTSVSWQMVSSVRGLSYGWRVFKVPHRDSDL